MSSLFLEDTAAGGNNGNFYELLGVAESATPEEIKRAYYGLVRRHRPTEQPDLCQRYSDAHQVLGDRRRRGAYDQMRRSGRRVQALMDQAAAALEKDTQKAINLLKSAVVLAPDLSRPRVLLAQVLMRVAEYEGAEKQFLWLIEESPRDENLRNKFAHLLWLQGRFDQTEEHLQVALTINPLHYDSLMLFARVCDSTNRFPQAVAFLERAIGDARQTPDIDALLRLLGLYLQHERASDADATKTRLLAALPENDPKSRGRMIQRICQRARELYQEGKDDASTVLALFAQTAAQTGEVDEAIRSEAQGVARFTTLTRQARRVMEDPLVEGALRDCIRLRYLERSTDEARNARMDDLLGRLQEEITADPRRLGSAIDYLRREYPEIAADQNAFLQELVARIVRRLQVLGPEGKYDGRKENDTSAAMPGGAESTPAATGRKTGVFGWLRGGK